MENVASIIHTIIVLNSMKVLLAVVRSCNLVPKVPIALPESLQLLVILLAFREMSEAFNDSFRCGFKLYKGHLPICTL